MTGGRHLSDKSISLNEKNVQLHTSCLTAGPLHHMTQRMDACLSMRRRSDPQTPPAVVAAAMLPVTSAAERCMLTLSPLFTGNSRLGQAVVTEAAGDQTTIDTGPEELLL